MRKTNRFTDSHGNRPSQFTRETIAFTKNKNASFLQVTTITHTRARGGIAQIGRVVAAGTAPPHTQSLAHTINIHNTS